MSFKIFLEDIKRQPKWARQSMFAFCLIITLSSIGMVWFGSFQQNLFVLLNPDQQTAEKFYAIAPSGTFGGGEAGGQTASIFGSIGNSFKDLKASISSLLGTEKDNQAQTNEELNVNSTRAYLLPLSGPKK